MFYWGDIVKKYQKWEVGKKLRVGGGGGVSVEEGSTSFTQYALQIQHSNDSNVEEKRFSFYKVLLLFLFFSNVLLVISLLSFLKHVTLMDRF